MALVKFLTGSAADFQGLGTKDQDTLYFITDERRIYKGDVPFSGGIYSTVEEFLTGTVLVIKLLFLLLERQFLPQAVMTN